MSEPITTAAVPQPEDKPTEVTPAVEPSSETKVEPPAPVPVCYLVAFTASSILILVLV